MRMRREGVSLPVLPLLYTCMLGVFWTLMPEYVYRFIGLCGFGFWLDLILSHSVCLYVWMYVCCLSHLHR